MLYLLIASVTIWLSVFGTYGNGLSFTQPNQSLSLNRQTGPKGASYTKEHSSSIKATRQHNYSGSPVQDRFSASSGYGSPPFSPPPRSSLAKPSYSIAKIFLPGRTRDAPRATPVDTESISGPHRDTNSDTQHHNGHSRRAHRRNVVLRQLTIRLIGRLSLVFNTCHRSHANYYNHFRL
jgi:hypothetical protein